MLQQLYNLADDALEYQLLDRRSFLRFLDLTESSSIPDAKTIWLFRDRLAQAASVTVKAAYGQARGRADINTVIEALSTIKENTDDSKVKSEVQLAACNLIPRLRNFVDSPTRGGYFLGESNLAVNNQFTVFEMSGLDGDDHLKQ